MVNIDSLLAPITDGSPSGVYLKLDRSAYRALRNSYNAAQSSFRQLVDTPDASSDQALLESNDDNWAQLRTATYHALTQSSNGSLSEIKTKAQNLFNADTQDTLMDLAQTYQNLDAIEQAIAQQCQPVNATPVSFKFIKENIAELINAIRYLTEDKFSKWPLDDQFRLIAEEAQAPPVESNSPETTYQATENAEVALTSSEPEAEQITTTPLLEPIESIPSNETHQPAAPAAMNIAGQIQNRDHAFHELRKLADYFKQTEPHSPVPFLLERAIRWGYLSLPELLQEMTGGNSQVLSHINQLTGMDNLEQTILKTIPEPQSVPEPVPTVSVSEVQNTSNEESQSATSIEPTTSEQSDTPNTTNQPEVKTTQSSSGITDFEW